MKKDLVEMVFILDRSGSMAGLESDTVGGYRSLIEKQKLEPGEALVTTVLFDDRYELLHDRVPLDAVCPMTDSDYYVRGGTALMDAIGLTIDKIGNAHKHMLPEFCPSRTVFVIITDGMENSSHQYTINQIRAMIERQKSRWHWEFLFLGANIDAIKTASRFGISPDRAAQYHSDSVGTRVNYEALDNAVCTLRRGAPMAAQWKAPIEKDFTERKK